MASTVRTCRQILKVAPALWTFLDHPDVEPTNNAAVGETFSAGVWALRPAVIHRKLSHGVQSQRGALCQSRFLTVTTTLKPNRSEASGLRITRAWNREGNALLRF